MNRLNKIFISTTLLTLIGCGQARHSDRATEAANVDSSTAERTPAVGESATAGVAVRATATPSAAPAEETIAAPTPPPSRQAAATGDPGELAYGPQGFEFFLGKLKTGTARSIDVAVTNTGGKAVQVDALTAAPFTVTPSAGCAALAPGANCTLRITFAATAPANPDQVVAVPWKQVGGNQVRTLGFHLWGYARAIGVPTFVGGKSVAAGNIRKILGAAVPLTFQNSGGDAVKCLGVSTDSDNPFDLEAVCSELEIFASNVYGKPRVATFSAMLKEGATLGKHDHSATFLLNNGFENVKLTVDITSNVTTDNTAPEARQYFAFPMYERTNAETSAPECKIGSATAKNCEDATTRFCKHNGYSVSVLQGNVAKTGTTGFLCVATTYAPVPLSAYAFRSVCDDAPHTGAEKAACSTQIARTCRDAKLAGGILREETASSRSVLCLGTQALAIADLSKYEPGCGGNWANGNLAPRSCNTAAARACQASGYIGGMIQDYVGAGPDGVVNCFQ